jgi:hypothetical protein
MRVATLLALESPAFTGPDPATASAPLLIHPHWDGGPGWTRTRNNLRLLLPPSVGACLLFPWLRVLPLPHRHAGLADLCALMNPFHPVFPT